MTPLQEWTYLQINLHNWDKGEAMPKRLQPGLLGRNADWPKTVAELVDMDKVMTTASGALFVTRAINSYRAALKTMGKRSNAGKTGAKKRWNNNNEDSSAKEEDGRNGDMIFSVDPGLWNDFREHRRKLKAPMTSRAEAGILKKLEAIKTEHGHDPTTVLDQSIRKGWRDVFPLKEDRDGNGPSDGFGLFNASRG